MNTTKENEKEMKKLQEKYCKQLVRLLMVDNVGFDQKKIIKLCNLDDTNFLPHIQK